MDSFFHILGFVLAAGIGMGCGSYATMPYYRLPNNIPCGGKWTGKKSACPKCGVQLRTRDLFPVLNWLWTRGKCFKCGTKINTMYFFIEASCTVLSLILWGAFAPEQINLYIIAMILATCLVIVTATDISYKKIPDAVLIVMVMAGFLWRSPEEFYDMVYIFTVAVLLCLIVAKLGQKKGWKIRYDYLKLFAIAGIWFTAWHFFLFLVLVGLMLIACRLSRLPAVLALTAPFAVVLF